MKEPQLKIIRYYKKQDSMNYIYQGKETKNIRYINLYIRIIAYYSKLYNGPQIY